MDLQCAHIISGKGWGKSHLRFQVAGSRFLLAPHVQSCGKRQEAAARDHGVQVKVTQLACMALYIQGLESVISRAETKFSEVFPNTGAAANCG